MKSTGFTLIEMMIVVSIIAIITSVAAQSFKDKTPIAGQETARPMSRCAD